MEYSVERIKEDARIFEGAAISLEAIDLGMRAITGESFSSRIIPIIVLKAFSCELFLKYKISFDYKKADKSKDNHALNTLFEKLEEAKKQHLKEEIIHKMQFMGYDYDETCFDADLINVAKAFEDWRYYYEKNRNTKFLFLYALFDSLREDNE